MRKILIALLLAVLLAGGAGYWYLHAAGGTMAFRTEAARRGDLLATISATGTLEPEDVVDVGAQVAGQIKEFGRDPQTGKVIDYGSSVEPGTVLARIDDALYQAKVEQSRALLNQAERKVDQAKAKVEEAKANQGQATANVAQAKARFSQAQRDWDRARQLLPSHAIAREESDTFQGNLETSQAAVGVSEAALVQAKASLVEAEAAVHDALAAVANARAVLHQDEINLGYCTIKSPVKGVIVDRRVTLGQTVQSSFNTPSLFLIAKDLQRMKVWASVNEADIGQVHVGQTVHFTVDAHPHDVFQGVVSLIRLNATMTQNVVTYTVEVLTDNPDGKLLPYLTANLRFEVGKLSQALLVPNAALRWRPQVSQVAPDLRDAYAKAQQRKEAAAEGPEKTAPDKGRQNRGLVWVQDGGFVRPVKVQLGLTDGNRTEVVGGDLPEGAALVTGETLPGGGADTTNPFAPQLFGGRKQQ
jgi:HlyD family secretion protein